MRVESQLEELSARIFKRERKLATVERNSPAWEAWRKWRLRHHLPISLMDESNEWTVPREWPDSEFEDELKQGSTGLAEKLGA